jgi:hypothetical protein
VEAADTIRERFGSRAITRARLLRSGIAQPFERDPMTSPEAPRVGRRREVVDENVDAVTTEPVEGD